MRTAVLIHLVWVATAVEALRCGQGSLYPDDAGNLPSGSVWNTQVCLEEDTACITMYTHNSQDSRFITGRCTSSCQESTLTYSTQDWVVTTCCDTDNCNSNLSDFSTFDWTTPRIGSIIPIATLPPLNTTFSCRQGMVAPMTDGRIQNIDNTTMMWDVAPCGDLSAQYCMTSYARSATNDRQIVASCANTCQNTTIAQAANNWLVITCCDTSNCNADLTTISSFDWDVARITTTTAVPINIVSSTGGSLLPPVGDSTVFGSFTLMPTQPPDAIHGNTSTSSTGIAIQNGVNLITPSILTLMLALIGMIVLSSSSTS